MRPLHRVVITGMGAVTPLGHTATDTWAALREGRVAIGPIENFPREGLRYGIAAEVHGFDPLKHFDEKKLIQYDRFAQFALVAAREAIAQSGIDFKADGRGENTAVIIGTGVGGETTHDEASKRLYGDNNPRLHPLTIVRLITNAATSHVCIEHGLNGPAFATSSACASANHALAQAFAMVRSGMVEAAVAGGSEACITLGVVRAWEAMRVMADDTCRPFSKQRRGMVLGEGAAVFVLETLESAQRRGATILAELAGAGMSADASDIVFPSQNGAARAISRALVDAELAPEGIDYINAHGTATPANDPTETKAIRQVFGAHADQLMVSSTKSMHGHALGAAGAIELVATIGALRDGVVPPTMNFVDPDPECDLDYVPNAARERPLRAALSNSLAFGGLNAVLALRRAP
ncbi:beta-ketoacyl-[acyl-carrier-protein] synthase family protein [Dokdonella sp.]|uniref:beta-ketoacyl-[acyl-carrier-protein] synthase family protein n=1 Tax=Dokdonella sp. TaxID=2291710 RepID=UPI0025BE9943|nr:beta-ketoacyl-[acyl-carrier-protein] synthase family protein [Dokdonella sp.]